MSILVCTFVLLIGKIIQIMDLMVNKGIAFPQIVKLVLYILPSFLIVTIPIALLIAILIAIGRLSGDNEITVMKSSGISLYQLLQPIMALSVITFMVTAVIGFLAPISNAATKDLLFDILKQKASIGIKEKVFNNDFQGLILYVDRIPIAGDFMEGIMVFDNRLSEEPAVVISPKGYLLSDPQSLIVMLRLFNGSIHSVGSSLRSYSKLEFSSYDLTLTLPTAISDAETAPTKGSKDMTIGELYRNIEAAKVKDNAYREMIIELNKKFSIPFSCLVFGIIAVPLGMASARSGKSRGFSVGLFVVALYYTLLLAGEAFGETGKISPIISVWSPNLVIGSLGVYFLISAAHERPLPSFFPDAFFRAIFQKLKKGK
jgi:lipopolysaccharide export system permease protein